jgi:putative ABC transport system substrate-binding protein
MTKQILLFVVTILLVTFSQPAEAQPTGKVARIGVLRPERPEDAAGESLIEAFRQSLLELGHVEGKNIVLEVRWAEGKRDRLFELAAELVRLKVDCLLTGGGTAGRAAKKATSTIPIVMANIDDPIGEGFVASHARPGGNMTGITSISTELSGKRLEVLKEAVSKLSRVAVLWNAANPSKLADFKETQTAGEIMGVAVQSLEVRAASEFESAFRIAAANNSNGLIVLQDILTDSHRPQIVGLAAKNRLPAMYARQEYVDAGGLMVYGVSLTYQYRRSAVFVDKILKGAKPAELPVEQPTKFELVINLKTAKQIGLTIPPNVLARADKVIK